MATKQKNAIFSAESVNKSECLTPHMLYKSANNYNKTAKGIDFAVVIT